MSEPKPNTSSAVMAQRHDRFKPSLDFFPTPPWATRALMEKVINSRSIPRMRCLEPACGAGHMVRPLAEYFATVIAEDIEDYGWIGLDAQIDFLAPLYGFQRQVDWIVTNPPFNKAAEFALRAMELSTRGVALFARTTFLESKGRYESLFKTLPPTVAVFSERVPLVKGRLDRKAFSATSYSWFVWQKHGIGSGRYMVIPPCRAELEKEADYD